MSAVVDRAEKAGKHVQPLIVPTNNPLFAVINAARDLQAQELIMGALERLFGRRADRADRVLLVQPARRRPAAADDPHPRPQPRPVFRPGRRQPHSQARRAPGPIGGRAARGGRRHQPRAVLHDGTPAGSDLFADVLTMLDPLVELTLVPLPRPVANENVLGGEGAAETDWIAQDLLRAKQLRRELAVRDLPAGDTCTQIASLAAAMKCNLIILGKQESSAEQAPLDCDAVVRQAQCAVCVVTLPKLPQEVEDPSNSS